MVALRLASTNEKVANLLGYFKHNLLKNQLVTLNVYVNVDIILVTETNIYLFTNQ